MAEDVHSTLAQGQLYGLSVTDVCNIFNNRNLNRSTIVARATSDFTHGEFSFLIDDDVLLAYFQLVGAVDFHIRLG